MKNWIILLLASILFVLLLVLWRLEKRTVKPVQPKIAKETIAEETWSCGGTVDDTDGNTYSTVKIGDQCWMGENMRTTKYPDGSSITKGPSANKIAGWNTDRSYYSCPPNISQSGEDCAAVGGAEKLGMLYQWLAAMNGSTITAGAQGICPSGWHIPTHDEFTTLEREVCTSGTCITDFPFNTTATELRGTDEGTKLKSGGTSGFECLLAGYRDADGGYCGRALAKSPDADGLWSPLAGLWSSTSAGSDAWLRDLFLHDATVGRGTDGKANGYSVRCLKD